MKRSLAIFLSLLLSLFLLILVSGCFPADPPPYIDCDVQALVDAINDANVDPGLTTIELSPGCTYVVDQAYADPHPTIGNVITGLPLITSDISIIGNGATITRPAYRDTYLKYRLFFVEVGAYLSLSDVTISNGFLDTGMTFDPYQGHGGAIFTLGELELNNVNFISNWSDGGGAVASRFNGSIEINGGGFWGNLSYIYGGAISSQGQGGAEIHNAVFSGNLSWTQTYASGSGRGAAIYSSSEMIISDCLFEDNQADLSGGAIYVHNSPDFEISGSSFVNNWAETESSVLEAGLSNVTIINSTISGNTSEFGEKSAIHNEGGSINIAFSTIANNLGDSPAVYSDNSNVTIANSIIVNNEGGDCDPSLVLTAEGNNLDSDGTCNGFFTADPLLQPLADNGGGTLTHALDPTSPAINQAQGNCPSTDQRGVSRPYSFACDLGAYEAEEIENCSVEYLIASINYANSDPDLTTIDLTPGCVYVVDQQYAENETGLPHITTEVVIVGNGATITRPDLAQLYDRYRLFYITDPGSLTLSDLTITRGHVYAPPMPTDSWQKDGGAILNRGYLHLNNLTFDYNHAAYGGAVANTYQGTMLIENCTFQNNVGEHSGGAVYANGDGGTIINNSSFLNNQSRGTPLVLGYGGALFNADQLTVTNSTFTGNESRRGAGVILNRGSVNFANCTFTGNQSTDNGAGLLQNEGISASILNSTISGNSTPAGDNYLFMAESGITSINYSTVFENTGGTAVFGGSEALDNYQYNVFNSIIANNTPVNCNFPGVFNALGNNLDSDGSCPGFTVTGDPLLLPLADNGGGTWTHAITMDSPALNAASVECPITDQRGVSRPQGVACDLGAYEYDGPQPTPSPTPEIDPCLYEALVNANCRVSDYPESGFITTLAQGESALLIGINPEDTHGLFDISGYDPCWILSSLMSAMNPGACDPPCYDPPPRPTPSLVCSADLDEAECIEAGGIYHPGFAAAPWCECP